MHLSFLLFLSIGGFPYLCLIMLILLVPDRWIEIALRRRRERLGRMILYYESGCGFCEKVCLLFREFLLAPNVAVLPASSDSTAQSLLIEHNSWVVRAPDGATRLKWRGVAYVLRQSALTAPLGWISDWGGLRVTAARSYDLIGRNRRALGTVTRWLLPFRSDQPPGPIVVALNGMLMALALASNLLSLGRPFTDQMPEEIYAPPAGLAARADEIVSLAQVRQSWALFAPGPTHWNWSFRFDARHKDGTTNDVTAAMPFVSSYAGGRVVFAHSFWQKYFSRVEILSQADLAALGRYLCRVGPAQATAIDLTLVRTPVTAAPGRRTETARHFACHADARPGTALPRSVRGDYAEAAAALGDAGGA